jgi:hypothetical protein
MKYKIHYDIVYLYYTNWGEGCNLNNQKSKYSSMISLGDDKEGKWRHVICFIIDERFHTNYSCMCSQLIDHDFDTFEEQTWLIN